MEDEIRIWSAEGRSSDEDTTDIERDLCGEWVEDSERECEGEPYTHVGIWPNKYVCCANSAIFEGEEFASIAERISRVTEEILGTAFVGEGVFLRDGGSSKRGDDKEVYRESD